MIPIQTLQEIESILTDTHKPLFSRLQTLNHPYHNKTHIEDVVKNTKTLLTHLVNQNLFSPIEKLLLVESAWRHDDGHCGKTIRQEVFPDQNISNEEYAVLLLMKDMHGKLNPESLEFIKGNILATSFGQNNPQNTPLGNPNYFRPYKPETANQKLLVLADILNFSHKNLDEWIEESLNVMVESPATAPKDLEGWIKTRKGFLGYITSLINSNRGTLQANYCDQLQEKVNSLSTDLDHLNENQRSKIEEKIREGLQQQSK